MLRRLIRSILRAPHPALREDRARRAVALLEAGDLDAAEAAARGAVREQPSAAPAHFALGLVLIGRGDFDEAAAAFVRALALAPRLTAARENLSRALLNARRFAEAGAVERELLRGEPDAVRLHLRLAHALLMQGQLEEGWTEYEWRLKQTGFSWGTQGLVRWDGGEPAGRTIRVVSEQGLGDAILFARFVPELARRGARVRLLCRPPLERLFRSSLDADDVHVTSDANEDASDVDAFVHLLSLPRALGLGDAAVARRARYLRVDAPLAETWRRRAAGDAALKVGLVWAGNAARSGDEARSLAAAVVAPLGDTDGIRWFSLQAGLDRAAPRPFALTDWMAEAADFADTAALIGALDLVISVDTSVAHAAAAVGTPLWLLAPHNVCWRWEMAGAASPWYPDVRLFRASRPGAWGPVIDSVGAALAARRAGGERGQDVPSDRRPAP